MRETTEEGGGGAGEGGGTADGARLARHGAGRRRQALPQYRRLASIARSPGSLIRRCVSWRGEERRGGKNGWGGEGDAAFSSDSVPPRSLHAAFLAP